MRINWFTVIAQVINFLLLVWLLKRYLYQPILVAIETREQKIAAELADAETQRQEAAREKDEFRQKNDAFERQKNELMQEAVGAAQDERLRLLDAARKDADALRSRLEAAFQESQEHLNQTAAQKTRQEVLALARKALADLATMSLEEQMVQAFIRRLNTLNDQEKERFASAFLAGSNTILVRSAFDLPEQSRTMLQRSVGQLLGANALLQFATAPELIGGIELLANGYKLAWSFPEYLNSMEKSISAAMQNP